MLELTDREQEEVDVLLEQVPDYLHKAYQQTMANLCNWYGDKAHRKIDEWHKCLLPLLGKVPPFRPDPELAHQVEGDKRTIRRYKRALGDQNAS